MAVKSLTITEEAYNKLKKKKKNGESFSEAIVRIMDKTSADLGSFLGILKESERGADEWIRDVKKERENFSKDLEKRHKRFKEIK